MIEIDPAYVFSYINRADMKYFQLKDFAGALVDYNKAVSIEPANTTAYMRRDLQKGILKISKGQWKIFPKRLNWNPRTFMPFLKGRKPNGSLETLLVRLPIIHFRSTGAQILGNLLQKGKR